MPARCIQADDQLTVQFEPGSWRLLGPDNTPVFEARPRALYYQPLFGRWRDLPPGDRMSVDAVLDIHVRWQRGWVAWCISCKKFSGDRENSFSRCSGAKGIRGFLF